MKVPEKHLKWRTCISEMDWEIHLNNQVQKYYKVRPEHKSSIPATPTLPHPKDHERKEKRQDNNRNKGNKQAPKEQNTIPTKPKQEEQARDTQEPQKNIEQTRKQQENTKENLLKALQTQPELSVAALAEWVDSTPASVRHHLRVLQTQGHIRRVGPDKGGRWEVLDLPEPGGAA